MIGQRPPSNAVTVMQRIAIVDPNEATRESLRGFLLSVDFVWLEAECARYEYFYDVINASKESMPDLAIVHLDSDKPRALQMIGEISVKYPKLQILTISKDHQALLLSLQRGAKYFLTDPVVLEDLLSALQRSVGESANSSGDSGSMSQASGGFALQDIHPATAPPRPIRGQQRPGPAKPRNAASCQIPVHAIFAVFTCRRNLVLEPLTTRESWGSVMLCSFSQH